MKSAVAEMRPRIVMPGPRGKEQAAPRHGRPRSPVSIEFAAAYGDGGRGNGSELAGGSCVVPRIVLTGAQWGSESESYGVGTWSKARRVSWIESSGERRPICGVIE